MNPPTKQPSGYPQDSSVAAPVAGHTPWRWNLPRVPKNKGVVNIHTIETLKARTVPNGDCWHWTRVCAGEMGYGMIRHLGKNMRANRVMYSLAKGPIPEGLFVLHKCDNPKCINPDHLWLGTHQDNMDDMMRKDRQVSGYERWTHCKRGHQFEPAGPDGVRRCQVCIKERQQRRNKMRREETASRLSLAQSSSPKGANQ